MKRKIVFSINRILAFLFSLTFHNRIELSSPSIGINISLTNTWKVSRISLKRRLRCVVPKMDFLKKRHGECVNFDNGTCKFFHFTNVDSQGSACPHFKSKHVAGTT